MDTNSSIVPSPQGHLAKLRPLQQQAIALMMEGESQVDIARRLGVDRVTVGRWYERDDFKAALNEQMAAVQAAVNAEIRDSQLRAVDTITALMNSEDAHDRTRLDAAKYLLEAARSLPEPPPVQGIPASEVLTIIDELSAGYDDIIDGMMGAMLEQVGFCTADEYRAMNPYEKAQMAFNASFLADVLTPNANSEASPNTLYLIKEAVEIGTEHPEWVEAANQRWAPQMERYQQFINSDEYQQYITETEQTDHATQTKTE